MSSNRFSISLLTVHNIQAAFLIALFTVTLVSLQINQFAQAADISGQYVWKPVRIGAGGWVRGMVVHPHNVNVRYCRADVGGAYRWDTKLNSWVQMKVEGVMPANVSSAPASQVTSSIAVDPSDQNVVLLAFGVFRSGDWQKDYPSIPLSVYRSDDGGRSFRSSDLAVKGSTENETDGEHLMVDPMDGKIVYFGSPNDGLWRSEDGGIKWKRVTGSGAPGASADVMFPVFDPYYGRVMLDGQPACKRIYVNVRKGPILMSNDGGATWSSITDGVALDTNAGAMAVDLASNLFVSSPSTGQIWKFSRTQKWTSVDSTIGGANSIAIDPHNPDRIFIAGGGGSLARSLDNGATFTKLGDRFFVSSPEIQWLSPSASHPQYGYISHGGVKIANDGSLWVPCGNNGILTAKPDDLVDTAQHPLVWTVSARGIEELVAERALLAPGQKPYLTCEDESGFLINDPDKFTATHYPITDWVNNNGLSSDQDIAYCPNQPKFYAISTDNMYSGNPQRNQFSGYTADGGETWSLFPSIVNQTNPPVLYGGLIAVSAREKGHENDPAGADNIVRVATNNNSQNSPAPFYSIDGGKTWAQSTSFDKESGFFKYNVNGTDWRFLGFQWGCWNASLREHLLVADPIKPHVFYLDLVAGGFWRSEDGGVTWQRTSGDHLLPTPMHHGQMDANPSKSGDLWIIDGYEGCDVQHDSVALHGLWHSTDGGDSWVYNDAFEYTMALALGKAAPGRSYPSIYVYGKLKADKHWGIFQSIDEGLTWNNISNYPLGLLDEPTDLGASWDKFGLVYVGFSGNSFAYGKPK